MKKLIALLLFAGFVMVTLSGCPSPTTSGAKPVTPATGGASTAK